MFFVAARIWTRRGTCRRFRNPRRADRDDGRELPRRDAAAGRHPISFRLDLHDVLDDQGNVVKTCPPDQGCGPNGTCVAACDSATANKSTIGCEYYSVDPDLVKPAQGACFAAYIANTWTTPISINVDRGGTVLDTSTFAMLPSGTGENLTYAPLTQNQLQPGEVAILFLAHVAPSDNTNIDVPCPTGITPAVNADAAVHGTGFGSAFHITTSLPTVAYDILPYGGGNAAATSATLLLPTSVWDTNYVAVNAFFATEYKGSAEDARSIRGAFARHRRRNRIDRNRRVTIKPTTDILAGGSVGGAAAHTPHTVHDQQRSGASVHATDRAHRKPDSSGPSHRALGSGESAHRRARHVLRGFGAPADPAGERARK